MIVLVFDPLAVLLLVAANWNMLHHRHGHWTEFFKKEKSEDFPDKEDVKEIVIKDDINLSDNTDIKTETHTEDIPVLENEETWSQRVIDEQQNEIPEIKIDEHNKDWEPNLYDRPNVKDVGRYMEETNKKPPKVQSFLNKVQNLFISPGVNIKTIEQEVDDLQYKDKQR